MLNAASSQTRRDREVVLHDFNRTRIPIPLQVQQNFEEIKRGFLELSSPQAACRRSNRDVHHSQPPQNTAAHSPPHTKSRTTGSFAAGY